MSGRRTMAV